MTSSLYRVAIVGAAGLKGRELKEVLGDRNFPALDIRLLDDDESLGQLEAVGEEATFIQSVRPDQFHGIDFTFFASDGEFTRRHWREATNAGSAVVDLSYGLEAEQNVPVRAPWVERELGEARVPGFGPDAVVAAHPAAVTLALLLLRLRKLSATERVIATLFEPVSERGRRGMDELHEQTVNLLSFHEMPKKVFDAQVAFNMLSQYGESAGTTLKTVEERIARHFRQITREQLPAPSLVLLHSPIFHAHLFSVYIELPREVSLADCAQALSGDHVAVMPEGAEAPNNVNVAGEEQIAISLRADAQRKNAFWIWAAADNLKLAALNAVDCAAALALTRSHGSVQ
jgi:aspartate-semialdehyde dehydrogenase